MNEKRVLIITGSPRVGGNSSLMASEFRRGAESAGAIVETIHSHETDIQFCAGCLRCNLIKRCALRDEAWNALAEKILTADILVWATPIYFHQVSAPLKKILDRFRCFLNVRITETGLIHTPWTAWKKEWVLLLSLGSPDTAEANPVSDMFRFMTSTLGAGNRLHTIIGSRLAVSGQINLDTTQLSALYAKLQLPHRLAVEDHRKNRRILQSCYYLARELASE